MNYSNAKPFNFIIYVLEMLYGLDLIGILLQSQDFYPLHAFPENDGIDKKVKLQNDDMVNVMASKINN